MVCNVNKVLQTNRTTATSAIKYNTVSWLCPSVFPMNVLDGISILSLNLKTQLIQNIVYER